MNARMVVLVGVVGVCAVLSASGCKSDAKDYDCAQTMDKLYAVDCGLYCNYDTDYIYIDTCAWYDTGDYSTFSQSDAEDVCGMMDDAAVDADCESEFQSLLNCVVKDRHNNCAENCENPYNDYIDCINNG